VPALRTETLRAARWRAARYGLDDRLMHPEKLTLAPAVDVVLDLLDLLRPDLEEHGEWEEMSALTAALLGRGTSAARQRKALADTGNLVSVTALLVAETLA
jgi:carboxylate-amine ligase